MENLVMLQEAFAGKKVWVSGSTGFKGSWLCQWLLALGAEIHGFALAPNTDPALFDQLGLDAHINNTLHDIRDAAAVQKSIARTNPDFVFHLAAQPLVRQSYREPLETYAVNVMGTAHVLDALRTLKKPCASVIVTTDKCYENSERPHRYREEDPLGGHDPYSSSKAAAELVTSAYRRSFFRDSPVRIASARAGNVIGGGDWAEDRIIPDSVRALAKDEPIRVRNKSSTRPWQHVLEPLSGYLALAASLAASDSQSPLCSAFNFGPGPDANRTVGELVGEVLQHMQGSWEDASDPHAPHEAGVLQLSIDKAAQLLDWSPVWNFRESVANTIEWYRTVAERPQSAAEFTRSQIGAYTKQAKAAGVRWAIG